MQNDLQRNAGNMRLVKRCYDEVQGSNIIFNIKEKIEPQISRFKENPDMFLYFDFDKGELMCLTENEMKKIYASPKDNYLSEAVKDFLGFLIYSCVSCLKMAGLEINTIYDLLMTHNLIK